MLNTPYTERDDQDKLPDIETNTTIVQLDTENYGKPPKWSGIKIIPWGDGLDPVIPQACKVWIRGQEQYVYNLPGALALSRYVGRQLPTIEELDAAMKRDPDNFKDWPRKASFDYCSISKDDYGFPISAYMMDSWESQREDELGPQMPRLIRFVKESDSTKTSPSPFHARFLQKVRSKVQKIRLWR